MPGPLLSLLPPSPRARSASVLAFSGFALLALAVALAGCDGGDGGGYDERLEPRLRSFEVDFDVEEASFEGAVASVAFETPELDPAVVRGGLVMAYVRTENAFGERVWRALPYSYGVEFTEDPEAGGSDGGEEAAVDYTVTLGFSYDVDFLEVFYELSDDDAFVWDQLAAQGPRRVKVVAFAEGAVRRNADLDFRRYEAVQQRFGLAP